MKKKTVIPQKKKRGPPATGKGAPIVVRMHPPMLAAVDGWIARQSQPFPTRPEAVRKLVDAALAGSGNKVMAAVAISDLKAVLDLLDAYSKREKRGARFKDDDQVAVDGFYAVRVANLRRALAATVRKDGEK